MKKRIAAFGLALTLVCSGPAMADPGINIDLLMQTSPGWLLTASTGDAKEGSVEAEQVIWPLFYLHWFPLKETAGKKLSAEEARTVVEGLWEEFVVDGALTPEPIKLAMHEGFMFETNAQHGELKVKYYVWACPESGRLFVADAGLSLLANAPELLVAWMRAIVDTVRCHRGAELNNYPFLKTTYEIPDADIAYSHPWSWRPLKAYRINTTYGGTNFRADSTEAVTFERGQDLLLVNDAVRRLSVSWRPAYDYPLGYDIAVQRAEDFWRDRANNFMSQQSLVEGNVWIVDGIVNRERLPSDIPPTHMHKFRTWVWRVEETEFVAVVSVGGIRFGRQRPGLELTEWIDTFQQNFEAIQVN